MMKRPQTWTMLTTTLGAGALLFGCMACNNSRSNTPANTASPGAPPASETRVASASAPSSSSPGTAPGTPADKDAKGWTRTFDDDQAGTPPKGFSFGRTGKGPPGRWIVQPDVEPNAGNVLAQLDQDDTSFRFPLAVLDAPPLEDVRVTVRCKMVSGRVDRACGIVARYQDENNYYITRANALEENIRLYTVRDGRRTELASHNGKVTPNTWHEYRLELRGEHLRIFWDGQNVLDHHDATFREAGRAGVWTKADSVTYFDGLRVEPL